MEDATPDFQDLLAAFDIPDMTVKISEVRSLAPVLTSSPNSTTKTVTTSSSTTAATVKQEPGSSGDDDQTPWPEAGSVDSEAQETEILGLQAPATQEGDLSFESPSAVMELESGAETLLNGPVSNGNTTGGCAKPQLETPPSAQHAKVFSSTLMANSWATAVSGNANPTVSMSPKTGKADKPSLLLASQVRGTRPTSSAASACTRPSGVITSPITVSVSASLVNNNNKHSKAPPLYIGNNVQSVVNKGRTPTIIMNLSKSPQGLQPIGAIKTFTGYQVLQVSAGDLLKRINPIPRFVPSPNFNQARAVVGARDAKSVKKRYPCEECGDIFLVESSLKLHLERRSVHIAFKCPFCFGNQNLIFYNKCSFHAHLRHHSRQKKLKINYTHAYTNATVTSLTYSKPPTQMNVWVADGIKVSFGSESVKSSTSDINLTSSTKETESSRAVQPPMTSGNATILVKSALAESINACPICLIKFTSESALQSHMQRYLPNQDVTCDACNMTLPNRCQLRLHSVMHSSVTGKWACPECARPISVPISFHMHISNNCMHWYRQLRVQCKLCSRMVSDYIQHLDKGHEMLFYRCVSCSMAFKNLPALKDHSERKHKVQPGAPLCRIISKCPFCETVFMQKPLLLAHIKMHIQQDGASKRKAWVYCCPKCPTTFSHLLKFKKHMFTLHPTVKHFHCDLCRRNFQSYEDLALHFETGKKSAESPTLICLAAKLRHFKKTQEPMKSGETLTINLPEAPNASKANNASKTPNTANSLNTSKSPKSPDDRKKEEQPLGKLYVKKTRTCPGCKKSGKVVYFSKGDDLREHMSKAHPEIKLSSINPEACFRYVTIKPEEEAREKASGTSSPQATESSNKRKSDGEMPDNSPRPKKKPKPKFVLPSEFTCSKSECNFQSKDRSEFRTHIQSHRHDLSLPQCEECGMCFRLNAALKRHLFIQHTIRDFDTYTRLLQGANPLPLPEKPTSSLKAVQETPEPVLPPTSSAEVSDKSTFLECQVCYKKFQNEGTLRTHMRNHGMAFIRSKRSVSSD